MSGAGEVAVAPCFAVRPIPTDGSPDRSDHILCHRDKGHDGAHGNDLYEWKDQ